MTHHYMMTHHNPLREFDFSFTTIVLYFLFYFQFFEFKNFLFQRKMAPEIDSQSDPILEYHYRGHKAPVLCSAFNPNQKQVWLPYFF